MPKGLSLMLSKAGDRPADLTDLEAVKAIADACRNELGFIRRATLEEALRERRLVVAKNGEDQSVLGFAHFRCTRHGHVTIYAIAVHPDWRGRGVGQALINVVIETAQRQKMQSLRLKCPIDLPANGFYSHLGFARITVEQGKCRAIAVWEKPLRSNNRYSRPSFFLTLTNDATSIRKVIRLWDGSSDLRDPFKHVVFTPVVSSGATVKLIRQLKEERGSMVMFDSGGYQVQMGRATYEELFDRLLRCYRENNWADWYVLPDRVPHSADSEREVEFKVRETLDFAKLFVRQMPDGFVEKAVGVVHGRTGEQVRRCVETYSDIGLRYIGFGSFGTSGPDGSVNMVSQTSLRLLRVAESLAREHGLRLHVFGIGSPNHLARLVKAGVSPDSFDSAGWWKAGGFGKIFFPGGCQLHITRMHKHTVTRQRIEYEKRRTQHSCPFCMDVLELRRKRILRIMHNLVSMLESVERGGNDENERTAVPYTAEYDP